VAYNFKSKKELVQINPGLYEYMLTVVGGKALMAETRIEEINSFLTGLDAFCDTLEEEAYD